MVLASAVLVQCLALDVSTTCLDLSEDGLTVCCVHRKSCFVWRCHPAENTFTVPPPQPLQPLHMTERPTERSGSALSTAPTDSGQSVVSVGSTGSNLSHAPSDVRTLAQAMGFQKSKTNTTTNTSHGKLRGKNRAAGHFILLARLNRFRTIVHQKVRRTSLCLGCTHPLIRSSPRDRSIGHSGSAFDPRRRTRHNMWR